MNIVPLLVLCSLLLALAGVVLFYLFVRGGDHEHADRLSLLPLEDDSGESSEKESSMKELPRK